MKGRYGRVAAPKMSFKTVDRVFASGATKVYARVIFYDAPGKGSWSFHYNGAAGCEALKTVRRSGRGHWLEARFNCTSDFGDIGAGCPGDVAIVDSSLPPTVFNYIELSKEPLQTQLSPFLANDLGKE